jgi:glutamine amidotransferase
MCRLLYVRSKQRFLITDHLQKFAQIARNSKEYQGHGWGCAYLVDGEWKLHKNLKPIWQDDVSSFGSTNLLIAHARSAFKDQNIHVQNNMPFFNGRFVFVFNGELHGVKIKEKGKIGAEKIFNFIQRFEKEDMHNAIQKGVNIIKKQSRYIKAMNFIIADKHRVYVSSDFNEDPEYFTLYYKITPDEFIISSEKYPEEANWQTLETNKIKVF